MEKINGRRVVWAQEKGLERTWRQQTLRNLGPKTGMGGSSQLGCAPKLGRVGADHGDVPPNRDERKCPVGLCP